MKNPFLYGEEVTGEFFCNRKKEIEQLKQYIHNANKILLYSPRRWGKTSLIKEAISQIPKRNYTVLYADLYAVSNEAEFIQTLASAFAKCFSGPLEKTVHMLRSLLHSLVPRITINQQGETAIEFGLDASRNKFTLVEELLETVSTYMKQKKGGVIILDEFQQIGELPNNRLEKVLRSHIQSHRHIAYIFAGSKQHLLFKMFSDPSRPFYKSSIHFPLYPIPEIELKNFVIARFRKAKFSIDNDIARYILTISRCHPYHTQQLCFHMCNMTAAGEEIDKELVDKARERILLEENAAYQNVYELLGRGQKAALKALARLEQDEAPFSSSFIRRAGLPSADAFRKGLESLVEKNIVEKDNGTYTMSDVFFNEWLSRLP